MSLDDDIRRAEHAKTLLADELVIEAFGQTQVQLVAAWIATPANAAAEREIIWHRLQASITFKEYFEKLVADGKHAIAKVEADKEGNAMTPENENTNIERALAVTEELEFEPDEEAPAQAPKNPAEKPDAAVAEEQPSGEETEQTPELTDPEEGTAAIEAPALWDDGLKARWGEIPPDLQSLLAQQEGRRNSGVDKKLNEAAAIRQQADQERQRFAQLADIAAQNLSSDPLLAIAARIGTPEWVKFSQENPGEAYAQEKAVEAHFGKLQQVQAERERVRAAEINDAVQRGDAEIARVIPDWKDAAKRQELGKQFVETAGKYGYQPKELEGMTDHRQILILRALTDYEKLKTAQQTLGTKRAMAPQARTMRPGSGERSNTADARSKALKSTALRTGKEQDSVNAILAIVGD